MKPNAELTAVANRLARMKEIVPKDSTWKHEKTGNLYHVTGHTILEADLTVAITYERTEVVNPLPWSRPSGEFLAKFTRFEEPSLDETPEETIVIDRPIHNWFGLSYSNYLVVPRLLLDSMTVDWQNRFIGLMDEIEEPLLAVPNYIVLRDESPYTVSVPEDGDDPQSKVAEYIPVLSDPWANYRHGNMQELIDAGKS